MKNGQKRNNVTSLDNVTEKLNGNDILKTIMA